MWSRFTLFSLFLSLIALPACASSSAAKAPEASARQLTPAVNSPPPAAPQSRIEKFEAWRQDFTERAVAKGYDRRLVTSLMRRAKISERAIKSNKNQPEFTRPIWGYVDTAVSATRLKNGRAELKSTASIFDQIEARYRVPRHILTAIWGLESAYGTNLGDYDLISALSSFAFEGRRTAFGEEQLFATFDMVTRGDVRADQLTSSWAGAMGMTQFIPATFRDYGVDFNGDGNKDLWHNKSDALGSAAHYLSRHGWRWVEPVFTEIKLPGDFDYGLSDGSTRSIKDWALLGALPYGGQNWAAGALPLEAKLLVPAGHKGPKLLTFKNFDVIKKYNKSTSYALGIATLGETLRGQRSFSTPWPRNDKPLSFSDKRAMQRKLTALGYDTGGIDGQIGPNSRRAIRAWQKTVGLPADGYIEQTLFKRLMQYR